MKTIAIKRLPAMVVFVVGILVLAGAAVFARPATAATYLFSALGLICLCLGAVMLAGARKQ
jgi:uncharacterized membrane protein HdeD (DUF308 family)